MSIIPRSHLIMFTGVATWRLSLPAAGIWALVTVAAFGDAVRVGPTSTSAAASPASTTTQAAAKPNLLAADGSFELGDADWCGTSRPHDDLAAGLAIDRSVAADGRASARFLVEPEDEQPVIRIPLPLIGTEKKKAYCLSLSLRASSLHSVSAGFSTGASAESNRWSVGPAWQRYHATFSNPTAGSAAAPSFVLAAEKAPEPWVLWVDAVKIEAGITPTAYQPSDCPLIGLSLGCPDHLFVEGQPVAISVGAQCPAGRVTGARLHWTLGNGEGRPGSGQLAIAAASTPPRSIHASPLPRGWYRISVELLARDGGLISRRQEVFAVIRPASAAGRGEAPAFEVWLPSRGPRHDALAKSIGVTVSMSLRTGQPTTVIAATLSSGPHRPLFAARIDELTRLRAKGCRTALWPTGWDELLDRRGHWQPAAVALNVWLDLLGGLTPLRSIRSKDNRVLIEVFSGADRSVAVALTDSNGPRKMRLDAPLPSNLVGAFEVFGAPLQVMRSGDHFQVDLTGGVIYLVAGAGLRRGRFALQLEDARIVAPVSSTRSAD
jgi:hypothetical protein